ncbi:unnamed protein product [Thelazia callipaeda]|uniref:Tudor domain-containing protein n=1 Tax=Thelazia callipaeda TaxID=103827 RepID=A0A0N5D805_THECL|nr:unnamed protein product [Thelazia callipaeda]
MKLGQFDRKWTQLVEMVDDEMRSIAMKANELRHRYIMKCLHITRPYNSPMENWAAQKNKSDFVNNRPKPYQNDTNFSDKAHMNTMSMHQQQYKKSGYGGVYMNRVQGSRPPFRSSVGFNSTDQMGQTSTFKRTDSNTIDNNKIGANVGSNSVVKSAVPEVPFPTKESDSNKVPKFYCDIEGKLRLINITYAILAALAGEISESENDVGSVIVNVASMEKIPSQNDLSHASDLSAKETSVSTVDEPWDTRVLRYPYGKPLELNVYVVDLEGPYAWVRLSDGEEPPRFDEVDMKLEAMKAVEWEEVFPGTPCVVYARFKSLDLVNDGRARGFTECGSYARAIVEYCNDSKKTVTVRLVDFGFRLTELDASAIKPLMINFDGPPLAFRLQIDSLPKVFFVLFKKCRRQKERLNRYVTLSTRLTPANERSYLCWPKTWKALDVQKEILNRNYNDYSGFRSTTQNFRHRQYVGQSLAPEMPTNMGKESKAMKCPNDEHSSPHSTQLSVGSNQPITCRFPMQTPARMQMFKPPKINPLTLVLKTDDKIRG